MRLSLRFSLFGAFALLVLVLAGFQLWIGNGSLREELEALLVRELRRELELAPALLEEVSAVQGELAPDSLARALSLRLGYPVTLFDAEGRVVGASAHLPFQLKGLAAGSDSPEVEAALKGGMGFSRRRGTGEVELRLFAASPVDFPWGRGVLQVAAPLDEINRAVGRHTQRILALTLLFLLLAAGLTWAMAGGIIRPLRVMARQARGVLAGKSLRRPPPSGGFLELEEVATAFHRLTEELQERSRGLEKERDEVQSLIDCMGEAVLALTADRKVLRANRAALELLDIAGPVSLVPAGALVRQPELRKLLEEAVERPFMARQVAVGERQLLVSARPVEGGGAVVTLLDVSELRRLEAVRKDFVANASHELKTPLTALRGYAETLLEDDVPADMRLSFLIAIRDNALRLQRLVDDLLDLSRLESGGWVARPEEVEVESVVAELFGQFSALARERGVALSVEGEATVLADPQGLEQILKNLLDNAIRYTPRGGQVVVEIRRADDRAVVAVKDTGIGIPSASLPRIFERFYRVDPARSRAEGGTGLGLAIVRHLVTAMGGEVWAESELGKGTTLTFTLPLAPAGRVG